MDWKTTAWKATACSGKVKYPTYEKAIERQKERAKRYANGLGHKHGRKPVKLEAYKCPFCGYFHQGHNRRRKFWEKK